MKKKTRDMVLIAVVAIMIVFFVPGILPKKVAAEKSSYNGDANGGVKMKAYFRDEQGNIVGEASIFDKVLAVVVSNGTRIKDVVVIVEWTTTDIAAGFDTATFSFIGTLGLDVNGDNSAGGGSDSWTTPYDVDPVGTPDISSNVLTDSRQWVLHVRQDLGLPQDAQNHGNKLPTDFDLVFTLNWDASMYDTVEQMTETLTGDPITLALQCSVIRGFRTVTNVR